MEEEGRLVNGGRREGYANFGLGQAKTKFGQTNWPVHLLCPALWQFQPPTRDHPDTGPPPPGPHPDHHPDQPPPGPAGRPKPLPTLKNKIGPNLVLAKLRLAKVGDALRGGEGERGQRGEGGGEGEGGGKEGRGGADVDLYVCRLVEKNSTTPNYNCNLNRNGVCPPSSLPPAPPSPARSPPPAPPAAPCRPLHLLLPSNPSNPSPSPP